ncbi:Major facilitator superfamily domain, general substrate transporter [Metarhizium album ARSEF 1941]|uniref:Major facilitator superfamily domain, general substrate transporter n=1 Tax=Metarhizium album (strain ARSEF 1941) TaxID=1081103 RepID=A0A0B2WZA3_METAS|nr:Major facilitator superfamily domain, general substrate transporter [Metarhizium album ARSEF 1941]KHO01627.1 Major facilitator superfamily domain, general substrate transporter [Metarhizium album ARSEF 1941]
MGGGGNDKVEAEALEVARAGGHRVDALLGEMEQELEACGRLKRSFFHLEFKDSKHFTWLLVAFASMGGLLSGLDQSLISGANLYLPKDLGLTPRENSLVNSGMPLGAVGGALILSPANEYFGRKGAIYLSLVLYTVGAALEAGAMDFGMIVAGRVILGLGVGLEGGTVPVYVAETVERRIRGNLVSLYQLMIALGEVLGYAVAAIFLRVPGNWRYILGSSLVFSTVMFGGVPRARRALVYANTMILLGQLTGVNAIMYYMSVLMNQIGYEAEKANYMSLVGGGSLLLGTIPAVFLMETCGRRFWAIMMLPGFFIGLVLIGIGYQINIETHTMAAEGCYLAGLITYMAFFGSYACLTWVVPSEVYPTYLRSYGMTTSDALLFLASFIVTYNFTAMEQVMTRTGLTLGFYGGIAVLGEIYQVFFMPETKNKTLEEIDMVFQRPTVDIVRENWSGVKENITDLCHGRFRKVFVAQTDRQPRIDELEKAFA